MCCRAVVVSCAISWPRRIHSLLPLTHLCAATLYHPCRCRCLSLPLCTLQPHTKPSCTTTQTLTGSIQPGVRQGLIQATLHLVNREFVALADDFVALGLLPRGSNMDEVIPALTGALCAD